ncbi:YjbF family lipoprotein [Bacillus sp. NP157]|nr:YjbF family lipoprotein [Bacillus sp. NP157]
MGWRRFASAALCLAIAGLGACSDLSRSLVQTVRGGVLGGDALPVSPAEVASRPLFQALAETQHGKGLLILGNVDGTREAWYGPHETAVFLEHGRIAKTANLDGDLVASRIVGMDPFAAGLNHVTDAVEYDSVDDWSPGYRFGVPVHGRLTRGALETVTILERPKTLLRIDERRDSAAAGWSVENHYWVDPDTGFIWKSQQTLAPGLRVEVTQLKPRLQGGP